MILLKWLRLINWYAFSNEEAPIGDFTLIAGKNGNGKSVVLDAIKYAAYGDTVFNKSSESKGSRTLSSYTRGLLDATEGTYMRPADKVPRVYSHIVMEYYDAVEEKPFVLGTVIETDAGNNCQALRYSMDGASLSDISHTRTENGQELPLSADELRSRYGLKLLLKEAGMQQFMQLTGLKLGASQLPTYLRKLRGMMSYDPNAKINNFIRDSVLEEKNVDFTKLIEAKENIERLNETFTAIETELAELDGILQKFDSYESEANNLLADDIKQVYKKRINAETEIAAKTQEQRLASAKREQLLERLHVLEQRDKETGERLARAKVSLGALDCMHEIEEEERKLRELEAEKEALSKKCQELELLQQKVSELLHVLMKEGEIFPERAVLSSLCGEQVSALEKEQAVQNLRQLLETRYDKLTEQIGVRNEACRQTEKAIAAELALKEQYQRHQNAYTLIPDYVGLKNELNRVFQKQGIRTEAKFACEYVIGLEDEEWRDAIEAFLGRRRYTILVEPEYYDLADEVLNHSQYRYAHLFNTKLLAKKEIRTEADSVVHKLHIQNPVAKMYFSYQLGRMHAVSLHEVRNYENALSKEGRVSVAMDSYFLRFDRLRAYYLGQETFALNAKRAEQRMEDLRAKKREMLNEIAELQQQKNLMGHSRPIFLKEYEYDAVSREKRVAESCAEHRRQLQALKKAQERNEEFIRLSQVVDQLEKEHGAIRQEQEQLNVECSTLLTTISLCEEKRMRAEEIQKEAAEQYQRYEEQAYAVVQRAVTAYRKYLDNNSQGPGGLMLPKSRERRRQEMEKEKRELQQQQGAYLARHPDVSLPTGTEERRPYAERKDRIWMDELQEIRKKLKDQTVRSISFRWNMRTTGRNTSRSLNMQSI